jgi:hypothetical protein
MKPDSENFGPLRRLLGLKRHEQPPPGYFNNFSREVIARIKTGEQGLLGERTWLHWLWTVLEAKPVLAGAFGVAVCALLIAGIMNSEEEEIASTSTLNPATAQAAGQFAHETPPVVNLSGLNYTESSSASNAATSLRVLFNPVPSLYAQPASETISLFGK